MATPEPPGGHRRLLVRGRGAVMVPALDYHDPDPPPRGWIVRDTSAMGDLVGESAATRTLRMARSLPPAAMTPGRRRKLKRDIIVLLALEAGVPERWVAEAVGLAHSAIGGIRRRYEGEHGQEAASATTGGRAKILGTRAKNSERSPPELG